MDLSKDYEILSGYQHIKVYKKINWVLSDYRKVYYFVKPSLCECWKQDKA